jgi:ATP-dependent Clp protease protease subunit
MAKKLATPPQEEEEGLPEIGVTGDLTDNSGEISDKLLSVPPGGECILYFDSPGGSPYGALSLMTLIQLRQLRATGIVTGECSSAAIWPFAACRRRIVTPFSVLLFHPMRWQSEEHVQLSEAAEWARHFQHLESQMDLLLADVLGCRVEKLTPWMQPGRYLSGPEFAAAGFAELINPFQDGPIRGLFDRAKTHTETRRRGV